MSFFKFEEGNKTILPGGIVRRVLAYSEDIMLSHWEVPGDAAIPPHEHPHAQFSIVMEGKAIYTIGDEERLLEAGDSCYIPPNVNHKVTTIGVPIVAIDAFAPIREDFLK